MQERGGRRPRERGRAAVVAAALVTAATGAGCGDAGDGPKGDRRAGTPPPHRQEAGDGAQVPVRRVEPDRPSWDGEPRLELAREIRGRSLSDSSADAERLPALTRLRDVATAGDGGVILVLDGAEATVTVLDSAGRTARRLARRGPGPGELRSPDRVERSRGGGVLVLERRPAAVHRWNADGSYAGRRELVVDGDRTTGAGLAGLADWGPGMGESRAVRLISLDAADPSASASAVHLADSTGRAGPPVVSWTKPGTASRLPEIFGARRSWTAGRGDDGKPRIAVARGDRYEVRTYDSAGALRAALRGSDEAVPVTDEMRQRALDRFVEEAARAGAPPGQLRRLRERIPVASSLPVLGGLWHSRPDGRLWVGLAGPGHRGDPSPAVRAYDVYRSDLRYLGRVPAPSGFRLHRVRGKRLYGAWRDSLEVPGVRVYRLVEPDVSRDRARR